VVAYVIAMMKINDPQIYREYTSRTPTTVKRYGGKFLTRGEPVATIEGEEYGDRMVILEFPSRKHAEGWFGDADYQEAMKYRHAASKMHRLLVQEGGSNTEDPDPKL
jgi:uncharacterized protein (DUF1330 family)